MTDTSSSCCLPLPPRCGGSGEIVETGSGPGFGLVVLHANDPAQVVTHWPCPGCADCLMGELITAAELEILDRRPEPVVIDVSAEGARVVAEAPNGLADATFL